MSRFFELICATQKNSLNAPKSRSARQTVRDINLNEMIEKKKKNVSEKEAIKHYDVVDMLLF